MSASRGRGCQPGRPWRTATLPPAVDRSGGPRTKAETPAPVRVSPPVIFSMVN
jgi:hypothetical protein